MKKLYILFFMITPLFVFGQHLHGEECSHERGEQLHSNLNYQPVQNQNKVMSDGIPYAENFENGFGDITLQQTGSEAYNWVIDNNHGSYDYATSQGHSNYLRMDDFQDSGFLENWIVTPTFNLGEVTEPTLSYWEHVHWADYAVDHLVMYSTDYDGDVSTANWTTIYNGIANNCDNTQSGVCGFQWVGEEHDLPSEDNLTIAFLYTGDWASDWLIDDIRVFDASGLSTNENQITDLAIFPNPIEGNFVTIETQLDGLKEIQVFNVSGKKVLDTTIDGNTLDVSSFNSGFYMLKVTINGQSNVSKLIIR